MRHGSGSNPYASYKDPNNVFLFFDDFDGTAVDTSKWNVFYKVGNNDCVVATTAAQNSFLIFEAQSDDVYSPFCYRALQSTTSFSPPVAYELRSLRAPNWGGIGSAGAYRGVDYSIYSDTPTSYGNNYVSVSYGEGGRHFLTAKDGNSYDSGDAWSGNPATYHDATIVWTPNKAAWYVNGALIVANADATKIPTIPLYVGFGAGHWGTTSYPSARIEVDKVFVRPYAEPEPVVSVGPTYLAP